MIELLPATSGILQLREPENDFIWYGNNLTEKNGTVHVKWKRFLGLGGKEKAGEG
jgi:hypothetical protein